MGIRLKVKTTETTRFSELSLKMDNFCGSCRTMLSKNSSFSALLIKPPILCTDKSGRK